MNSTNLKDFFHDIANKYKNGIPDPTSEETIENLRMNAEMIEMILNNIKKIKEKKERIEKLKESIQARRELISQFTEFILGVNEKFTHLHHQATRDNVNVYSPYNNTKPISSQDILKYAKTISYTLQPPRNYIENSPLPNNFVYPFPIEDVIARSYLYFNSRVDGKVKKES